MSRGLGTNFGLGTNLGYEYCAVPPIRTKLSYFSGFEKCTIPLRFNQQLSNLVNLLYTPYS